MIAKLPEQDDGGGRFSAIGAICVDLGCTYVLEVALVTRSALAG